MADGGGGWKALDTAALPDLLHAATAAGRMASAAKAVSLGYAIEPDDGPSGRLGHWRIAGMPERACELFSKRSAEITAAVESKGYDTYQARQTAARDTRKASGTPRQTISSLAGAPSWLLSASPPPVSSPTSTPPGLLAVGWCRRGCRTASFRLWWPTASVRRGAWRSARCSPDPTSSSRLPR
jgi:hypothetical protein